MLRCGRVQRLRCDVNLHTDILDTPDIFWDEAAKPGFGLENMGTPQNFMVKHHCPHTVYPIFRLTNPFKFKQMLQPWLECVGSG